eukprot:4758694-Ditylum_brightwellii.AAC.1
MEATTISEIENAWVCPIYGFEDNIDYYRKMSCGYFLDSIAVPTFIINAGDDPFFDPEYFPSEKGCDGGPDAAPIKMLRTEHGGHLGYLFHQQEQTKEIVDDEDEFSASWMPSELARFLDHVSSKQSATHKESDGDILNANNVDLLLTEAVGASDKEAEEATKIVVAEPDANPPQT